MGPTPLPERQHPDATRGSSSDGEAAGGKKKHSGGPLGANGLSSLIVACLCVASMNFTAPGAMILMFMTTPHNGPPAFPWLVALLFYSAPVLFAVISVVLAIRAVRGSPRRSGDWKAAVAAMCICGLVVVLALVTGLRLLGLY
ncbi:hypothetical protein ACIQCN_11440 [Pseudarthrobacter sp. NPDC092424]|uniref:hypothetical protein n=1 Tax=Pseudarthrobacter sp. NPDC092424 TaxID=3364415 RepID=UPI0037F8886E